MILHTYKITPNASPIEECCLERSDKRFGAAVQLILLILSLNLLSAFPFVFVGGIISLVIAALFMSLGRVWAYALAKLTAMAFLAVYSLDVLAHIPLMPLPALSSETASTPLILSEILGIWLSAMLYTNLQPVPIGTLFRSH